MGDICILIGLREHLVAGCISLNLPNTPKGGSGTYKGPEAQSGQ